MDAHHPWDQQPGEPDASYARFLVYRNLGMGRSIDAAAKAVTGGKKRAGGNWWAEAAARRWHARAEAWDTHVLIAEGRQAVRRYVELLSGMAETGAEALRTKAVQPSSWSDLLHTVQVLGACIPPETIQAIATAQMPADAGPIPGAENLEAANSHPQG
jgi:hypothetical protein